MFAVLASLSPEQQEELLWFVQDYLPMAMFVTLGCLLFSGYPVAFVLGGLALLYGLIGYLLGVFSLIEFFNFLPRIWGQAAENLVLVSIPAFVFMGIMMERSGVAADLLYTVQVLLKRVPGALVAGGHDHGHDPRRDDRDHRRLGDHDDRARAADHDAPGLQPCARLRQHRRRRARSAS